MSVLGLSRFEAAWLTPAVVLYRMQRAYLERQGEEQKWAKTTGDKLAEQYDPDEV